MRRKNKIYFFFIRANEHSGEQKIFFFTQTEKNYYFYTFKNILAREKYLGEHIY